MSPDEFSNETLYIKKKYNLLFLKRLAGATLLVFANKQDIAGSLTSEEIREVSFQRISLLIIFFCFNQELRVMIKFS